MKLISTFFIFFFSTSSILAQEDDAVKVYYENSESELTIYADNKGIFPKSVSIKMEYKGFRIKEKAKEFYVIPPNTEKISIIALELTGQGKASFGFEYTIYTGDMNAKHNDDFAYSLPYRDEIAFKLTQGYNGKFSHQSKKALDFTMPIGTKIVAARAGLVIEKNEDSNKGCAKVKCLDMANYITILHDDGSFAQYYHLKKNGVEVALSDRVEQGELIGYSGDTGYASGPHLHFEVNIATLGGIQTVPTQFFVNGKKQLLELGNMYASEAKN